MSEKKDLKIDEQEQTVNNDTVLETRTSFNDNKVEVRKPSEFNVDLTFKDNQAISNGRVLNATRGDASQWIAYETIGNSTIIREDGSVDVVVETIVTPIEHKGLSLEDLRTFAANGHSVSAVYGYLKDYIKENKDDPDALQNTVSMLLGDIEDFYDHDKVHEKVGGSQVEILDKILTTNEGEEVRALICGTIHDFVAQTLEECGIKTCILTGGDMPDGGSHATLLYQRPDGKYVFNNYSKNMVIEAASIKDAAKEVFKRSGSLESSGMIAFQDKDNSSYQEFAFREEAAFGSEIDKRDYNSVSPFDNSVAQRPSVDGNVTVTSKGDISANAGGTLAYGNNTVSKETSLDVEYKKNGETSLFLNSQSIGGKVEHKSIDENSGVYYNVKGAVSYTGGEVGKLDFASAVDAQDDKGIVRTNGTSDNNYITAMFHGEVGKKQTLVEDENLKLTNVGQASIHTFGTMGLGNISKSASVDGRVSLEEGFGIQNEVGNISLNNTISGGGVFDLTHTCDEVKPTFGVKLNASSQIGYKPNDNLSVGAGVRGYSVFTKSSKDYGIQAGVNAEYKPDGSKVSLFGSANVNVERQNLSVGLFNEQTEKNTTLNTTLGAQLNKNTSVQVGYSRHNNALNKTRNYNQFNIGAQFTF